MLTGKYWEAKRAFTEARNRLATADPSNVKTLATEISMALAIIESPQATESFAKDVTTANTAGTSNTNTSAAPAAFNRSEAANLSLRFKQDHTTCNGEVETDLVLHRNER